MGNFTANNLRYNPFTQTFTAYGYGYSGNPKEVHTIPASSPYWIYLNEIPRNDIPSTLFINEQGGSNWTEVSASTSPAAGQFRVWYGSDGTDTVTNAGQGIVEFNSADAGKIMEVKYYGLGNILQNQFLNDLFDGDYGTPAFGAGLQTDTISEKTAATGVTIDGVLLKDNSVNVDTINEKTGAAGVTIDGAKIKDKNGQFDNVRNSAGTGAPGFPLGLGSGATQSGYTNTAVGYNSIAGTTYSNQSAFGYKANADSTGSSGSGATSLGAESDATGAGATAIGVYAQATGDNSSSFGNMATASSNNSIVIGNFDVSSIGGYANWSNLSDKRDKININNFDFDSIEILKKIDAKKFKWNLRARYLKRDKDNKLLKDKNNKAIIDDKEFNKKNKQGKRNHLGFIAQDIDSIIGDKAGIVKKSDFNNDDHIDEWRIDYTEITALLWDICKKQQKKIEFLEKKFNGNQD